MSLFRSLFLVTGVLFLCACQPQQKGLRAVIVSDIKSLDPAAAGDRYSQQFVSQIYESLFHYQVDQRPIQLEPLLAKSWPRISPDRKTYTFEIKPEIRFHDHPLFSNRVTRHLEVADIIASWKRLLDPHKPQIGRLVSWRPHFRKQRMGKNRF